MTENSRAFGIALFDINLTLEIGNLSFSCQFPPYCQLLLIIQY